MTHDLKTWTKYFQRIFTGQKNFELRKNDRNFVVGDTLRLQEWDEKTGVYSGREIFVTVTYILEGGQFGLENGFVIMSIKPIL